MLKNQYSPFGIDMNRYKNPGWQEDMSKARRGLTSMGMQLNPFATSFGIGGVIDANGRSALENVASLEIQQLDHFSDTIDKFTEKENEPTVADIHNAVDNIGEIMLAEANKILQDATEEEIQEYLALDKMGFNSLGKIDKFKIANEIKTEVEESLSLSGYYEEKYGKKFITAKMLAIICKKYSLIFSEAKRYTGTIPTFARKEILSFPIIEAKDAANLGKFMMVAPSEMFDTKGSYVNDKQELVYDPICLKTVNGGYLVVTKWGAEENLDEIK